MHEAIDDVDFIEETDHILSLVPRRIQFLYAIEHDDEDDLVRQDPCLFQEMLVTVLDTFDGALQHVFGFTVHADADCQLYPPFWSFLEEREQSMPSWMLFLLSVVTLAE